MENLIQNGSVIGIILLFLNMAVFSQISSRTKAKRGDTKMMHDELEQWLGNESKNEVLNLVVAFLGLGATIWLPIYIGLLAGVWYGLASFIVLLFLSTILGNFLFKFAWFRFLYSICSFTGAFGLYLTIVSLIN